MKTRSEKLFTCKWHDWFIPLRSADAGPNWTQPSPSSSSPTPTNLEMEAQARQAGGSWVCKEEVLDQELRNKNLLGLIFSSTSFPYQPIHPCPRPWHQGSRVQQRSTINNVL